MSAQIVDPDRYKKTTRKKSIKEKENIKKELKKQEKLQKKIKENKIVDSKKNGKKEYSYLKAISDSLKPKDKITVDIKKRTINKEVKRKRKNEHIIKESRKKIPILKVIVFILVIIAISITSKIIVKKYKNSINSDLVEANNNIGEVVPLVQDSNLSIANSKVDSMDVKSSRNIVLNEINNLTGIRLIEFNSNYEFNYQAATKIEKLSNKEYLITLNNEYGINIDDIKKEVQKIKQIGDNNIYYKTISKIKEIVSIDDNTIKITLTEDQPYFIYSLDFSITKENTEKEKYRLLSSNENEIQFKRVNSNSTVKDISYIKYDDIDNLISDFRNNKIDVFTASSESIMSLIGKHDYSIKKYRDGKTLFMLGNSNSKLFEIKEVRKAILYSINRDKILAELNTNFIEKIDIPYIYSDIKYKYDTYGAGNLLTSQGWTKTSGVYCKKIDGEDIKLEITLLVNAEDSLKVKVAEKIKSMLEENGIKVNLKSCAKDEFNATLSEKAYDIVLADVYINNIPDISFIEEYLKVSDIVSSAINIVKNSSIDELPKNIESLETIISNEVACIGIYATNTNVVYQTNISGIANIGYMNIFNKFTNIGKIQSTN